jgi:hypothetical protein
MLPEWSFHWPHYFNLPQKAHDLLRRMLEPPDDESVSAERAPGPVSRLHI